MKTGRFGQKFQTNKNRTGKHRSWISVFRILRWKDFPGKGEKYEKKATEKMENYSSGLFAVGVFQRQMGSGSRRKPGNGEQ